MTECQKLCGPKCRNQPKWSKSALLFNMVYSNFRVIHGPNKSTLGMTSSYLRSSNTEYVNQTPRPERCWLSAATIQTSKHLQLFHTHTIFSQPDSSTPLTDKQLQFFKFTDSWVAVCSWSSTEQASSVTYQQRIPPK